MHPPIVSADPAALWLYSPAFEPAFALANRRNNFFLRNLRKFLDSGVAVY
jgi:hypothetical protein